MTQRIIREEIEFRDEQAKAGVDQIYAGKDYKKWSDWIDYKHEVGIWMLTLTREFLK